MCKSFRACLLVALAITSMAQTSNASTITQVVQNNKTYLCLENQYLKVLVNPRGARIDGFTYKPTGRQEAVVAEMIGGLCEDRFGGEGYPSDISTSPYQFKIVQSSGSRVSAEMPFAAREQDHKGLVFTKTYTLQDDSSALEVGWSIANTSETSHQVVPWVHNLVAWYGNTVGDMALLTSDGIQTSRSGKEFFEPATNWFARFPRAYSPDNSLVYLVVDHNQIFQFYNCYFNLWHSMELVYQATNLLPGKKWETRYYVAASPALEKVDYATVELAASAKVNGSSLKLDLSPTVDLGEVQVKAALVRGNESRDLPTKNVTLTPGLAVSIDYAVPDLAQGRYQLKASLYRGKTHIPLGKEVRAYDSDAVLPIVVGDPPKESRAVKVWPRIDQSGWKKIIPRDLSYPFVYRSAAGSVWSAPLLERVFKNDHNASTGKARPSVKVSAARRERESFQLVLAPRVGWNNVKVTVEPFHKRGSKDTIGLSWHRIGYIETKVPSRYDGNLPVGQWPDPLLGPSEFNAAAAENTSLLFTVRVPETAAAGDYKGKIRISANGGRVSFSVDVALNVWDFVLPATPSFKCMVGASVLFGDAQAVANDVGCRVPLTQIERQISDSALEHRITPSAVDFSQSYDQVAREIEYNLKHGMSVIGVSPNLMADPEKLKEVTLFLKSKGWLKYAWVYCPYDEAPPDRLKEVIGWLDKWKSITSIPIMMTYYHREAPDLFGKVDIWCRGLSDEEWLKKRMAAGDNCWIVNSYLLSLESPYIYGRLMPWRAFRTGYAGQLLWAVGQWNTNPWVNPWHAGENGAGCLYYPYKTGFLESMRLETVTDSLEDYEYLNLLKEGAENLAATKRALLLVAEAKAIYANPKLDRQITSIDDLLRLRQRIAELIVRIGKAAK